MIYPDELVQEATIRMQGRAVEGFVAGQGPLHPKLMLVGEAPGKTELDNHLPFSGQAGKELMQTLALAGLTREDVYTAYFDTYSQMDELKNWLMTIGNLYCIGRNGQHRYNNMDHSMLTAMEAVKAFLNPDYDRTIIWEVNTEKEYHEEQGK